MVYRSQLLTNKQMIPNQHRDGRVEINVNEFDQEIYVQSEYFSIWDRAMSANFQHLLTRLSAYSASVQYIYVGYLLVKWLI